MMPDGTCMLDSEMPGYTSSHNTGGGYRRGGRVNRRKFATGGELFLLFRSSLLISPKNIF